ncbi:hypothetical protein [Bacillus sp. ISL-39]|uniref:hypothetical protein n=1 Tax=Bacillus sp. ISL-39 TaxID=2819124 RepID=UPI001BE9FB33|nr:hypothetical protein [Bacillus sp. ISL-39]MBT2638879.1 hypothetical protein [Bacillus sp. ISL-39]
MNYKRRIIFLVFSMLFITGCSSEPKEDTKAQEVVKSEQKEKETAEKAAGADMPNEKEEEFDLDSSPVPSNLEEMMVYPVGPLASAEGIGDEGVKNALEAIPALSEEASESELTSLFEHLFTF